MNTIKQHGQDRHIRVFVSSTFLDMQADRDILVKKVFPQLRKLCESRGVIWTDVDLRWGITSEQQAEGKTLPYCLAEIERSRPYFIGLLAERYGWIPERVPADLLETQPWLREHLEKSVTELEIIHGVLNNPGMAQKALFYFRDPTYAASVPDSQKNGFIETGSDAAHKRRKLAELKNRIRKLAKQKKLAFTPREDYANPQVLGELLLSDFTKIINELYPAELLPDPLEKETSHHKQYAHSSLELYISRPNLFRVLDEHVESTSQPLVLTGEPGCGKTALLANWAERRREKHPNDLLIEHYVGASPDSANTAAMLIRLLQQIRRDIGFESEIPTSPEYIYGWFEYLVNEAARKRSFILIIDGVDEVNPNPKLPALGWLPAEFTSSCRVILSASCKQALELLEKRGFPVLHIKPLEDNERRCLLETSLNSRGKTLPQKVVEKLISSPHTGNPLFLTWLLNELCCVGQLDRLAIRLEECLCADGLEALLGLMVERWLLDYSEDCDLACQSLILLVAARDGLSENELLSVLKTKEGRPVPRALATPFLFAAEPVLARSGHEMHIRRGLMERVIRRLAAPTPDDVVHAHQQLVEYFQKLDDIAERKLRELPWHLAKINRWQELHNLLVRPTFLKLLVDRSEQDLIDCWKQLRPRFDPAVSYQTGWNAWRQSYARDREWASLSNACGRALYALGNYESSLDMLKEAAEVFALVGGYQSGQYANTTKILGAALSKIGRGLEAVEWLRKALDSCRQTMGVYNPETFSTMTSLAGCMIGLGDYASAEPLLRQVIDASKEIYGLHAKTTLIAMNNLGGLLERRFAFVEAELLQRQVLETLRQTTSGDDQFLLTAMNNLAGSLENQGKLDEAEPLYRQALTGRIRALGERHPDSIQSMGNLGRLLKKRGDIPAAESLFERGLAILEQEATSNSVTWAILSQNYAILLAGKGDLSTAEQQCRQSLVCFRSALPQGHPDVLGCVENLGEILLKNEKPSEAAALFREAIDGYKQTVGKGHPRFKPVVLALASALAAQGDRNAALSLMQVHGIWGSAEDEPSFEPEHPPAPHTLRPVDANCQEAALKAVVAAGSHDDLYAVLEQFGFITGTNFISRLEALAARHSSDTRGVLLERVALLRHLAAGKPLSSECNPVSEAFEALCKATNPGDEMMLLRLYPFLRSASMLKVMRLMAEEVPGEIAREMVARITECVDSEILEGEDGSTE